MGVSISIPCDPWINKISIWLDEKVGYTHNIVKNLVAMETAMENLEAKRDDLSRKVKREEDRGLQRLAEFEVWFNRVETVKIEVNNLLSARYVQLQMLCLCGFCSKSFISSYRYGKKVFLTLREVEKLERRVFEVIAEQAQIFEVQERPLESTIVGQETMLDKAWKHLMEDGVGIMGLYGMGGVGKTTLLTQINNKLCDMRCGFDLVIWVVVSKELDVEKIQNEIAHKVGLGEQEEWNQKDKSQKCIDLYNFLRKKRFMLFLDDVWEKVDLAEIGIPFPKTRNKCKVAFTTRSQDVCAYMGVEKPIEVQCLLENDAFDLFQKKVGNITLGSDPEIPDLARIVARKCCGLPLALNIIGETMSCKRTVQEWRYAIDVLNSYAIEFYGMKDKILPLLKYSYDNLKGKQIKSCLLYCALFPEDEGIPKEKLIDYWICEGIINTSKCIEKAENNGYEIIGSLVRASLLIEGVNGLGKDIVCMHDVVREMALWIASDFGIQKEAFIVHAGVGLFEMPKVENWNVVRRMSLMKNKNLLFTNSPECLQLTTLLLQEANLANISSEFFRSMSRLLVLDLSDNGKLNKLPRGISNLVSLQYLNLSNTSICHLSKGLQELKKLIHLDLDKTSKLHNIAGISRLHNLKVLKLAYSSFSWDLDTVKELETLDCLEILTATIDDHSPGPELLLSSHRLMSCTRFLRISNMGSSLISLPGTMDKLYHFSITGCNIYEIKMGRINIKSKTVSLQHNMRTPCFLNLSKVNIEYCVNLRDLTLLMFVPNLRSLYVLYSMQLEDIINKEKACEGEKSGIVPFQKLIYLHLAGLRKLKNIYRSFLPLPCLEEIHVEACPNLKQLPLDFKSGKFGGNGLIITYTEKEWIKGVEWVDEATKTRFLTSSRLKV